MPEVLRVKLASRPHAVTWGPPNQRGFGRFREVRLCVRGRGHLACRVSPCCGWRRLEGQVIRGSAEDPSDLAPNPRTPPPLCPPSRVSSVTRGGGVPPTRTVVAQIGEKRLAHILTVDRWSTLTSLHKVPHVALKFPTSLRAGGLLSPSDTWDVPVCGVGF